MFRSLYKNLRRASTISITSTSSDVSDDLRNSTDSNKSLKRNKSLVAKQIEIEDFSEEEILLLRTTFRDLLAKRRKEVAMALFECIAIQVDGAMSRFMASNHFKADDTSAGVDLGLIFLTGIEGFLLRMDDPVLLRTWVYRLVTMHFREFNVSRQIMSTSLLAVESVFIRELRHIHKHKSSSTPAVSSQINCDTCVLWARYFKFMADTISSGGKKK